MSYMGCFGRTGPKSCLLLASMLEVPGEWGETAMQVLSPLGRAGPCCHPTTPAKDPEESRNQKLHPEPLSKNRERKNTRELSSTCRSQRGANFEPSGFVNRKP